MIGRIGAAAIASCLMLAGAHALSSQAEGLLYQSEHAAYEAAISSGDVQAAADAAERAWRAAEESLGDAEATGRFAFDFARAALTSDPDAAAPALARAEALMQQGLVAIPAGQLDAYKSYLEYQESGRKLNPLRRAKRDLVKAIKSSEGEPLEFGLMWLDFADAEFGLARYPDALDSAKQAEAHITNGGLSDFHYLAEALKIAGAAIVAPPARSMERLNAGYRRLFRAYELFPAQTDIDSFDPLLAETYAWILAGRATERTLLRNKQTSISEFDKAALEPPLRLIIADPAEQCGVQWAERQPPRYPRLGPDRGRVGAVVIGYGLNEEGAVQNARVLGSAPKGLFEESALEAVQSWKAAMPVPENEACRANFLISLEFFILR